MSVAAFDIETVLPLTPLQHGMLFHSLLDPASANYFQQLVVVLEGDLDGAAFEAAMADLISRHAALRAAFLWERQDSPRQAILRRVRMPTVRLDWSGVDTADREVFLTRFLNEDRAVPFTLSQAPLMRLAVIRTAADSHILVFSHHHLIMDGWSTAVMMEELLALYAGRVRRTAPVLPAPPRYTDYLAWLASRDEAATRQFWREALRDFTGPTPLAADRRSGAAESAAFTTFTHILAPATRRRLEDFARASRVSSAVPVMAAWALALGRQAERDEVVFGVTVAGRPAALPGMERLVGLCINTIPLRVEAPRAGKLGPWLRGVQDRLAAAQPFEHAGLTEIQGWSELPAGVPLFETILVYENYPVGAPAPDAPLTLASARIEERANYPLALVVEPQPDGLHLSLTADANRIPLDAARRLLGQVAYLLETLAAAGEETGIEALDLLTADERKRIVQDWNDTAADYERTATLHGLFVRQAARTPDAVALIDAAGAVTYGELDWLSRRLADRIEAADLPPGRPVAVRMARDRFLVAGLLAILRSGRAYVPLVRSLPGERVKDILETLSIPCVLTQAAFADETASLLGDPTMGVTVRVLAADQPEAVPAAPDRGSAEDLAYVIFTSGSTGRPKGVMVRHRPAINLIEWVNDSFAVEPSDRLLFVTSPAFDLSVYDLFGILAVGGSIRIAGDDEVEDPERLAAILAHEPITFWDSAPAALWQLAPLLPSLVENSTLRLIFLSGDWVPLPLPDRMRACFPGVSVVALGGATEATIWSNYHVVDRVDPDWRSIPYGRPIQNARYYILDPDLRPVPPWVPGDLFIGGECLSDGYAGEPELTAAKFIPDPFVQSPDARMYRTGDRARFLPDGTMEFLGRIDGQVKIRGFRIELGEVEAALARCPAVKDAVAVLHVTGSGGPASGDEEREIVGYVVPRDMRTLDPSAVTAHLRTLLPAPMVPAHIVMLDALPLTANGKVDRKALPAPVQQGPSAGTSADTDMVADIVARVWAGVLGLDSVPNDADFFALGGHSLRATSVIAQLRIAFGLEIPLALLFCHPTVRGLSAAIAALQTGGDAFPTEIAPLDRSGPLPLSQAQERLWFLHRLEPDSPFYTIVLAARLTGRLDPAIVEQAVARVAARHEPLRCRIAERDGRPVQIATAPDEPVPIRLFDAGQMTDANAEALAILRREAERPFDLERELPYRVVLVRLAADRALAVILMHHIVADGWSIGLFAQEFLSLYDALIDGRPDPLPALPVQYADVAAWHEARLARGALDNQLDYWRATLAGLPTLDLPTDRPRPAVQRFVGAVAPIALSEALSGKVRTLARNEACTLFMVCLAAFQVVLRHRSGQDDIVVGTDLAGRTHPLAERLIGFFVNQLVLRIDHGGTATFRDMLRATRRRVLEGFFHQDVPFDTLVRVLNPPRDPGRMPLFQVKFVLQNTPFAGFDSRHIQVEPVETPTGTAKYDLLLTLSDTDPLSGTLEYSTDLFDAATAEAIVTDLRMVLELVTAEPTTPYASLAAVLSADHAARADLGRQELRRLGLQKLKQLRCPRIAS